MVKRRLKTIVAAMSDYDRRHKAAQQPRDANGRWVGAGANVRWRSNGQDWAGTVLSMTEGLARIEVRHSDGSTSMTSVMPETLAVTRTKARLGSSAKRYWDHDDNTDLWIGQHKPELEEDGSDSGFIVRRKDGYSIEGARVKDQPSGSAEGTPEHGNGEESEEQTSGELVRTHNGWKYQVYDPSGGSIGTYGEQTEGSFNEIIEDHKYSTGPLDHDSKTIRKAPGSMTSSGVYSVPDSVKNEIEAALSNADSLPKEDIEKAKAFCGEDQVSLEQVKWMNDFFELTRRLEKLYGGDKGQRWSEKIIEKKPLLHDFESGNYDYFTASATDDDDTPHHLIAVSLLDDNVYIWDVDDFVGPVATVQDFDAAVIIPIDPITAREMAYILLESPEWRPEDVFPEERNMFSLASSGLDWDILSKISAFAYESDQRSVDASSQARHSGKFAKVNYSTVTVDGEPEEDTKQATEDAVAQSEAEGGSTEEDPEKTAKYFALTDAIDTSSVLEFVAVSSLNGETVVFRRSMGSWTPDEKIKAELLSAVPPTVVHLTDTEEIKNVIRQVDEYDDITPADEKEEDQSTTEKVGEAVVAAGFALSDGRARVLDEQDLAYQVNEFSGTEDMDVIHHLVKRATALGRRQMVPQDMVALSQARPARQLVGEFGDTIVASSESSTAPIDAVSTLRNYWVFGPKAEHIKWGTEGDRDRAVTHFAKYIGEEKARSLALAYHIYHRYL